MSLIALVCSVDGCDQPIHTRKVFMRPDGSRAVIALCETDSDVRPVAQEPELVGAKALRVAQ